MSNRKLIGVIISDVTTPYQKSFIDAFLPEALKTDFDILVFSPLCRTGMAEDHISGEFNIFDLINFNMLDGLVIVPDTLSLNVRKTRKFIDFIYNNCSKPAVCVDYTDPRFDVVLTDDEHGLELVVDHLIEVHSLTDIVFIAGYKNHPHSDMRISGYRNSLEKHGINYNENNVYFRNFWYDMGDKLVNDIMKRNRIPQAIVCANEPTALSVADVLEKRGYKIPDDIIIAGFDADGERIFKKNVLTSYSRDVHTTGINAARKIISHITGVKYEEYVNADTKVRIGESCGCPPDNLNKNAYKPKGYKYIDETGGFSTLYDFMHENMIRSSDINEYMASVDWYTYFLKGFDRFSICINDDLLNGQDVMESCSSGYTNEMVMIFDKDSVSKSVDLNRKFNKDIIYPHIGENRDKPPVFYFSPFHFYKSSFGYTVLEYDGRPQTYNQYYPRWMRYINTSF